MNAYKFNGAAGWLLKDTISEHLKIPYNLIYNKVKDILSDGKILMHDGKIYELTLTELENEQVKTTIDDDKYIKRPETD